MNNTFNKEYIAFPLKTPTLYFNYQNSYNIYKWHNTKRIQTTQFLIKIIELTYDD